MLLLLLACAGKGDTGVEAPDDTAPPLDTTSETGTPIVDCGLLGGIALTGERIPGETVHAAVTIGSDREDIEVTWEVEEGALSTEVGVATEWTLPTDVAEHVAREMAITATARAPGCVSELLTEAVEVDWPAPLRTLVVYNAALPESAEVASYYAAFRGIPEAQLCPVSSADTTTLTGKEWPTFVTTVQACIDAVGPHVMYVVPTYGVPYKVADLVHDIGYPDVVATVSLDALLVFGIDSADAPEAIYNPMYLPGDSLTGTYDPYVPFGELRRSLRAYDHLYLVTRIDGASAAEAQALVDRTAAAEDLVARGELAGTVYVDGRMGDKPPATDEFGSYEGGEWNIVGTRRVMEADGRFPVVWDGNDAEFGTKPAPTSCPDALFYAGWYSYYNYNDVFTWNVGAIGGHLDSCSACDIRGGSTWSSMALQRGITATFGAVNEPYVAGMPEYDQFFLYLTQGANFAEAAYESTVVGRWMMVWVGDPLYRPLPVE